jgi:hypothetical protein
MLRSVLIPCPHLSTDVDRTLLRYAQDTQIILLYMSFRVKESFNFFYSISKPRPSPFPQNSTCTFLVLFFMGEGEREKWRGYDELQHLERNL